MQRNSSIEDKEHGGSTWISHVVFCWFFFSFIVRFPKGIEISKMKTNTPSHWRKCDNLKETQDKPRLKLESSYGQVVHARGIKGGISNSSRYSELPGFSWMDRKELDTCMFTLHVYVLPYKQFSAYYPYIYSLLK